MEVYLMEEKLQTLPLYNLQAKTRMNSVKLIHWPHQLLIGTLLGEVVPSSTWQASKQKRKLSSKVLNSLLLFPSGLFDAVSKLHRIFVPQPTGWQHNPLTPAHPPLVILSSLLLWVWIGPQRISTLFRVLLTFRPKFHQLSSPYTGSYKIWAPFKVFSCSSIWRWMQGPSLHPPEFNQSYFLHHHSCNLTPISSMGQKAGRPHGQLGSCF